MLYYFTSERLLITGLAAVCITAVTVLLPYNSTIQVPDVRPERVAPWTLPVPNFPTVSTFQIPTKGVFWTCTVQGAVTHTPSAIATMRSIAALERQRHSDGNSSASSSKRSDRERYIALLQPGVPDGLYLLASVSTGWPLRCFDGHVACSTEYNRTSHIAMGAIGKIDSTNGWHIGIRSIPYTPRPLPLLCTLVIWMCGIWLTVDLCNGIRRVLRIRRKRCGRCSYDLQHCVGVTCPECGAALR